MNASAPATEPWKVWAALGTVYVVWGSTYLAIRVMVRTVPALLGAGLRFALAGALMLAWLEARAGHVRLSRRELGGAALVGTLLAAGGNGLVTLAERQVASSLAALIIASVPLWVVVLRALLHERPEAGTLLGVAVGFLGVGLLLLPGGHGAAASSGGLALLVLAALSWATGTVASPRIVLPADPLRSTAVQMLAGGAVMVLAGLARGEETSFRASGLSGESVGAFVYLVLIGSIVAFSAYSWLLQHAPIAKVATYAYVNPAIAVLLGWLILSESISPETLAGAAVIVASVAFIVRRAPRDRAGGLETAPAGSESGAPG